VTAGGSPGGGMPKSNIEDKYTHSDARCREYDYHSEEICDGNRDTFLNAIRTVHRATPQGFAAVKVTALGQPALLERASAALVQVRELFSRFDRDGSGTVTHEEFHRIYSEHFQDASEARTDKLFQYLDSSHDGVIDYMEWTNRVRLEDMKDIAARCREKGPFSLAALSAEELMLWQAMVGRVEALANEAAELQVRLMVDAEHSYFQPAIDHLVLGLQRQHNRAAPTIYNTYQCYLRDSRHRLLTDILRSEREGFFWGAKLVRGAYLVLETERAQRLGLENPIQPSYQATSANFHACVDDALRAVKESGAAVMVASHNQASVEYTLKGMERTGIPTGSGVSFGQLLGMSDHLTFTLGNHGLRAYKYVPYGRVGQVVPFLLRRAQENCDVVSNAGREMQLIAAELWRRLWPWSSSQP